MSTLEQLAVESHKANEPWERFWRRVSAAVKDEARFNARRLHDLHDRLFALQRFGDGPMHTPATWAQDAAAQETILG